MAQAKAQTQAPQALPEPGFVKDLRRSGTPPAGLAAVPPAPAGATVTEAELAPHRIPGAEEHVFIDGRFAPEHSRLTPGDRPLARSLAEAIRRPAESLEMHLGRHAGDAGAVAANNARFTDGLFLDLPPRCAAGTIHFLHVATAHAPAASHLRNLVVAGSRSQATFVESYVGLAGAATLTTAVTELVAGTDSRILHAVLQLENLHGGHHGHLALRLGRGARVETTTLSVGAHHSARTVDCRLQGEGSEAQVDGLLLATADQEVDAPISVEHAAPHTTSRQLWKAVLDGRARGRFVGNVLVQAAAPKTNAEQTNRNLLLSEGARMDTTPQLEINTDDVKCSHGSTIGQLSQDALFFLRARGIGPEDAKLLLTKAFAHEVIERAPPPVQPMLDHLLTQWFACRRAVGKEAGGGETSALPKGALD